MSYELIYLIINRSSYSVSEVLVVLKSGEHCAFAFSEANSESIALADTTEVDGVSINEELALFTTG